MGAFLAHSTLAFVVILVPTFAIAGTTPSGTLVEAMGAPDDTTMVCSVYVNKGKRDTVVSRVDGKKIEKKDFWSGRAIQSKLSVLGRAINSLRRQKSTSGRQKLSQALTSRSLLTLAKLQIARCKGASKPPVLFEHVQPILQNKCMLCHQVLGWSNTKAFFLDSGRVAPGDLEASPLYTFLAKNPERYTPGTMPKGRAPLSTLQLRLVRQFVLDLARPDVSPPAPTPTPDGITSESRALYTANCASCHGPMAVSSKWGRTAAQIRAALAAVSQMRHLRGTLSDAQIESIAAGLGRVRPPQEGTLSVRSLGPAAEGNPSDPQHALRFEIALDGFASQPFTVGYVTTDGTALADSDYTFSAGTLTFTGTRGESKIVEIPIFADSIEEPNETVELSIGGVSYGGVRIATSSALGTITNDDTFIQNPPRQGNQVRMAYGFNGDYTDALGLANGVPQGDAVISTAAKIGIGSLELDAGPDYVSLPGSNLQGVSNFTFAAWVYWTNPTASSITNLRLFDFGSGTGNYIYFMPRNLTTSNGRCEFRIQATSGTAVAQCASGVMLPANRWVHVATTIDATAREMKVFFDGLLVASGSSGTALPAGVTFTDNRLGRGRSTTGDFAGRIDEVLVWDAVLTPTDIGLVMGMDQSASFDSGLEVRRGSEIIPNGSTVDLGSLAVGESGYQTFTIRNNGPRQLSLSSENNRVRILGRDATLFNVPQQVWGWQQRLNPGSSTVFSVKFAPTDPGEKRATLVIANSDLSDGNFAIGLTARGTGEPLPEPTPPADQDPGLSEGQRLYAENCSSCHGALVSSQKRGATAAQIGAAINPSTGITQMRQIALNASQLDLVALALSSPVRDSTESERVRGARLPMGTASYVQTVLRDIFLPDDPATFTSDDTSIANRINEYVLGRRSNGTEISRRVMFFGGTCEPIFEDLCWEESRFSTQLPQSTVPRTGYVQAVCQTVLSIDRAVDNLAARVQRSPTSPPDTAAAKEVYKLFFPGRELPQYLADVIANFPQGAAGFTSRDYWRYIADLFCSSDEWGGL